MMEELPLSKFREFVERITLEQLPRVHRRWTGNDESAHNHQGDVLLSENPLFIRLFWKSAPQSSIREIGCFKLSLSKLISRDFVRQRGNIVKLRFFHTGNQILIQRGQQWGGIPIGYF